MTLPGYRETRRGRTPHRQPRKTERAALRLSDTHSPVRCDGKTQRTPRRKGAAHRNTAGGLMGVMSEAETGRGAFSAAASGRDDREKERAGKRVPPIGHFGWSLLC